MTLLFRTDATYAIGTGHVMRCIALAQAWQDTGGNAIFAMAETTDGVRQRLQDEGFEIVSVEAKAGSVEDARQLVESVEHNGAHWLVVDGYHFDADYQSALKAGGRKVLFLDDYGHARHYAADFILNQNAGAQENLYQNREPYTRLLLGASYALLRREFITPRASKREIPAVGRRVLITMGGSDPENFTVRAMRALSRVEIEGVEAVVVSGGSNPHSELLERAAAELRGKLTVTRNVADMAQLMAWADAAISGAGSTCWEICRSGLPALIVDLAENQRPLAEELDRRGCVFHLGNFRDVSEEIMAERLTWLLRSPDVRRSMSLRGQELVDGHGAARVASVLRGRGNLHLRSVEERDCRLLWEWANDPDVRAASFSPEPIPWEKHEAWFTRKMKDPDCRILIAEDEQGRAIGQFRVDWRSREDADIDVSVSSEYRRAGYGPVLIDLGVTYALAERRGARLHAFVKPENRASRRAFELAEFESLGEEYVNGHAAIHYLRTGNRDRALRSG